MEFSRVGIRLFAFLAAFLVLFQHAWASEASFSGGGKWPGNRIRIAVSRSLETSPNIRGNLPDTVTRSISLWSSVADIRFVLTTTELQSVSKKGVRGDGVSLVTAAPTAENARLFPNESNSPAAITRVFTDPRGRIVEADIVLNPFVRFSTDGAFDTYDLQETLTHEIGHLLGLDHSSFLGSIMHDRASKNSGPADFAGSRAALPSMDIASIRTLYGPNADEFACCGSVSGNILGHVRGARSQIWVEESGTGRLVAGGSPKDDGTFRIEGISEGDYILRAFVREPNGKVTSSEAKLSLSALDSKTIILKLPSSAAGVVPDLLGTSFQVGRSAVRFSSGYRSLLIGGDDSLLRVARIGISGSDVWIAAGEPISFEGSQSVKVLQFDLSTFSELSPGEYSLVIEDINGVRTFMPGVLNISK